MLVRLTPLALALVLAGCAAPGLTEGPKNLAPANFAQLPPANPGAATMTAAFVDSAQLQRVVDEVLANNRDLRGAAARLKQAEALADAADRLEEGNPSPRLLAALSGTIESLRDPLGLEHDAFAERARHFAGRLETTVSTSDASQRSPVLDRLFVSEAHEQLELLRDALAALPPDAYVLTTEALKLAQDAETLEIWGVMHLARQFADAVTQNTNELDGNAAREQLLALLDTLEKTIAAVPT